MICFILHASTKHTYLYAATAATYSLLFQGDAIAAISCFSLYIPHDIIYLPLPCINIGHTYHTSQFHNIYWLL